MLELNRLYNMDCMEGMKDFPDKYFDLAIVDPPYGIKMDSGFTNGKTVNYVDKRNNRKYNIKRKQYPIKKWDNEIPNREYFIELKRISKNQILWGANHYISNNPFNSSCWIIWDKVNGNTNQSDCELAWTSFNTANRIFRYMWTGMLQGKSESEGFLRQGNYKLYEKRIHPTQKPAILYKWLLKNYAKPDFKIIDTHAGSCSSVIAFLDFGCQWIAFEIDKDYFESASKRIENHKAQLKLQL